MLVAVAAKTKSVIYVGRKGSRHERLYKNCLELFDEKHELGFLTDQNEFLNRKEAAKHAFKCGQVKTLNNSITSEELW